MQPHWLTIIRALAESIIEQLLHNDSNLNNLNNLDKEITYVIYDQTCIKNMIFIYLNWKNIRILYLLSWTTFFCGRNGVSSQL